MVAFVTFGDVEFVTGASSAVSGMTMTSPADASGAFERTGTAAAEPDGWPTGPTGQRIHLWCAVPGPQGPATFDHLDRPSGPTVVVGPHELVVGPHVVCGRAGTHAEDEPSPAHGVEGRRRLRQLLGIA